ncbi:MAG TPA: anthranilate phosphoribosyltransferase, partial [Isosphaeraceae bacterium]|nr:anthranilate phosphoribosyltransferase [Isosphaeraceae bacterium]
MTPLDEALTILAAGRSLDASQAYGAVGAIMTGHASEAAIASFLTALQVKGETAAELAGAVQAVREHMAPLEGKFPPLLDTCGTGGDGANTLNISTAAAVVVAACGVAVAKHGNRSATSRSSSATVLAELGVAYDLEPADCARCLLELGITFLFAPRFHPAMRFAAPVRQV